MNDACDDVLSNLNAFLDGEVDEASADEVREHLAACEPCMDDFEVRLALRRVLQRCCFAEKAPESLRLKVVTQISVSRSWYWQV
jgi:anti-sigma factor (TIGR02949 family)